jgi:hypothetical protein
MSELSILPRRGFLRQLCGLPLIGGGLSLIGAPTATAEPGTPEMLSVDKLWLHFEHRAWPTKWPASIAIEATITRATRYIEANAGMEWHFRQANIPRAVGKELQNSPRPAPRSCSALSAAIGGTEGKVRAARASAPLAKACGAFSWAL